jgi:uncharacterized protein YneF (UPF0154 family)
MNQKSKKQTLQANSVPNIEDGLLTKAEYIQTPEYIAYCKRVMPTIFEKLPKHYTKKIKEILLANGYNYSEKYIRECLRTCRASYNIFVTKAAEAYIKEHCLDPGEIVMSLPSETSSRGAKKPKKDVFAGLRGGTFKKATI